MDKIIDYYYENGFLNENFFKKVPKIKEHKSKPIEINGTKITVSTTEVIDAD